MKIVAFSFLHRAVGTSGKLQHGAELGVLKPVLGTSMSLICHY